MKQTAEEKLKRVQILQAEIKEMQSNPDLRGQYKEKVLELNKLGRSIALMGRKKVKEYLSQLE